jgi:DNA-binding NarL/FixJ family response regulator
VSAVPTLVAADDLRLRTRIAAALTGAGLPLRVLGAAEEVLAGPPGPRLLVTACDPDDAAQRRALRALARACEELRMIVVCEARGGRCARLAVERWIDGFVFAQALEVTLIPTVTAVLAGQTVVPRRLREHLNRPTLSYREKQILALVVLGYTNGQIGARLFLAESTVKSHLSSSFAKLGVRSRSDAAALVLDPEESRGLGMESIIEAFSVASAGPSEPALAAVTG